MALVCQEKGLNSLSFGPPHSSPLSQDQASASATKVLATYQSYYGSLNHTQQLLQRVAEKPYTRLVTSAETATSSLTASASAEQVSLI